MDESEVKGFLASKMNIQIATIDKNGDPTIQPVWYYYDPAAGKIYVTTDRRTQKVQNARRKDTAYFSVDEDAHPYRCVKGKAKIKVSEDVGRNLPAVEKIAEKYLGTIEHEFAKRMLAEVKSGESVVLEMTPAYYSVWTFGKQ